MASRVKISSRNQIVIPAEARRALGIGPGDHLLVSACDGYIFMMPEPENYVEHLRGLHKEIWADVDVEEYFNELRGPWPA